MATISVIGLKYAARHAMLGQLARARILRNGFTPNGHPLWTDEEDAAVRELYPDYIALQKRLKRRTYYACKWRARYLKLVTPRVPWTAAEISRLRRVYGTCSVSELVAQFPNRTADQIRHRATPLGVRRPRKIIKSSGIPIIDEIKKRARQLNYSMRDVDELSRSKRYFIKASWLPNGTVNYQAIGRAVEALGGKLSVTWED
jgi:hypothetical protein